MSIYSFCKVYRKHLYWGKTSSDNILCSNCVHVSSCVQEWIYLEISSISLWAASLHILAHDVEIYSGKRVPSRSFFHGWLECRYIVNPIANPVVTGENFGRILLLCSVFNRGASLAEIWVFLECMEQIIYNAVESITLVAIKLKHRSLEENFWYIRFSWNQQCSQYPNIWSIMWKVVNPRTTKYQKGNREDTGMLLDNFSLKHSVLLNKV